MTTKLQKITALAAFATLFYVGCGDDDGNEAPGKGGSSSSSGGKPGSGGGATTEGGKPSAGGKPGSSGGSTSMAGNASGGAGGEPVVPEGGSAGGGGAPVTPEGGSSGAGAGGGGSVREPCGTTTYDAAAKCYKDCEPAKTNKSEQFLNHCSEAGAECTPFDNGSLTKLGANGALPPLP
jgi:hypothetical protein